MGRVIEKRVISIDRKHQGYESDSENIADDTAGGFSAFAQYTKLFFCFVALGSVAAGVDCDCVGACLFELLAGYLATGNYSCTNAGSDIVCTGISNFAA